MIEVNNLTKKIDGQVILDHVHMHVRKGTIYGLIGPNGAGKTTLIKHLIGSYIQDEGEVLFEGEPIYENNEMKKRMVYIPDEFPTTFGSNIKEIASFYAKLYPSWNEARYHSLISAFNQNELKRFNSFSKGMKKQVSFILSLSIMPDYLIMDEPFDGLDPMMRQKIWQILMDDVQNRQMTIIISSHHLKELDTMCDDVLFLNKGKVMFEYELETLKHDVHKIQVAFHKEMMYEQAKEAVKLIKSVTVGKIHTWIVEGDKEAIEESLELYHPMFLEFIPLDLEEIFTYTLGGEVHEASQFTVL